MQPSNFDELTKALASSTSRRQALRVIVTTSVGGLLGLTSISTAFGKNSPCHRNGTACSANAKCCSNFCLRGKCRCPAAPTCNSVCPCPSGQTCVNGACCPSANVCGSGAGATCGCPNGQVCLNDECAPCITAENICTGNSTCCSGICCQGTASTAICCASGQTCLSNGTCVRNCDSCTNPCACYSTRLFCSGSLRGSCPSGSDNDCPRGQFCNTDTLECFDTC